MSPLRNKIIFRKTVISGGMGDAILYEFSHDENVKYESEETKLYKKHLGRILSKKVNESDDEYDPQDRGEGE